uniref:Uncharacterized protein n=1 Tax=Arundo donax TaxID=35708 RepID=A0A0A8ZIJ2_ARUDO
MTSSLSIWRSNMQLLNKICIL